MSRPRPPPFPVPLDAQSSHVPRDLQEFAVAIAEFIRTLQQMDTTDADVNRRVIDEVLADHDQFG